MQDTINIAAVDDLPADLERLGAALETYAAQHELTIEVSGFRSGEELLEAAASGGFDTVFLDIVMDGIDGLETARRLRALGSEALIVFVTTEAGYALEGYEVEAAGFLVKGAGESGQRRFERLMDRLLRRLRLEEYIDLSATAASVRVPADEVLYAEVLNHRMRLLTRAGEFLLRMTVEELKPMLPKDGRFYECHRGIVINLDAVGTLEAQVVVMENGDRLPVSRRRRPSLEQAYAERSIARVRSEL